MSVTVTKDEIIENTDLLEHDKDRIQDSIDRAKAEFKTDFEKQSDLEESNEPDLYQTAQEALSWLVAFYVHKKRGEHANAEVAMDEYERLISDLTDDEMTEDGQPKERFFNPTSSVTTSIDDRYSE